MLFILLKKKGGILKKKKGRIKTHQRKRRGPRGTFGSPV
jgi:hypothetical protein